MIEVTIENYIRRVQLSQKRRAKYFKTTDKLPEKYKNDRYGFKASPYGILLYDFKNKEYVVENPVAAGTPSYQSIAGNEIMRIHERKRMKVLEGLEEQFGKAIKSQMNPIPHEMYPLSIRMIVHSVYGPANWDLDNLWIYHKSFQDTLVKLGMIKNDNVIYIKDAGRTTFVSIKENETPKLVFIIDKHFEDKIVTTDLNIRELPGEPGTVTFSADKLTATIHTGKKKIIFGAAKDAIRKVIIHALNNHCYMRVPSSLYSRYKKFFDVANEFNLPFLVENE